MRFVTAANHRFEQHAIKCVDSILFHGYEVEVFDLGGLGFGHKHEINDPIFQSTGCYETGFTKWRSRAMHVVEVVSKAMELIKSDELLIYVDADTQLLDRVDELENQVLHVGLTARPESGREILGKANSGVIMLRHDPETFQFIEQWKFDTKNIGNIQEGLNAASVEYPDYTTFFPCSVYNNYWQTDSPPEGTKIIHYRASMSDK